MEWSGNIIVLAFAWLAIGGIHAIVQRSECEAKFCREYNVPIYSGNGDLVALYPHRDILRLMDMDVIFTTLYGPAGFVIISLDWIIRNWPECLVLGHTKTTPAPTKAPVIPQENVNLEPLRRRASIFNNIVRPL